MTGQRRRGHGHLPENQGHVSDAGPPRPPRPVKILRTRHLGHGENLGETERGCNAIIPVGDSYL